MPGTLSSLSRPELVTFTAALGDESVSIVFDANKQTLRNELKAKREIEAGNTEAIVDQLAGLLVSWDVVDDDGKPVPLTKDVLLDLPSKVIVAISEGIGEASTISSAEGNASSTPSASQPSSTSTQDSQSSPNGSDTSSSPAPSAAPS